MGRAPPSLQRNIVQSFYVATEKKRQRELHEYAIRSIIAQESPLLSLGSEDEETDQIFA
jgi:hypothetical protein